MIQAALDHLWQSTLFVFVIGMFVFLLRKNSARLRYGLWLAASVKFLFPFAVLVALGRSLSPHFASNPSTPVLLPLGPAMRPLAQAMQPAFLAVTEPAAAHPVLASIQPDWTLILIVLWSTGFLAVIARWALRWAQLRNVLRDSVDFPLSAPVDVKVAPSSMEPGLVGIFRPIILLPKGITERLSREELIAVITHELCHARRRDNLTAAVHMFVEAVFWFYPLVWWLGTMLNSERERACDETVLAYGTEPEVYVDSIVKVCQFTVNSPLACASGVSGANLRNRIETIMENQVIHRLNGAKKILLASSAAAAIIIPLLAGVIESTSAFARAQSGEGSDMSPVLVDLLGTKAVFAATLPKLVAVASSKPATSAILPTSPPAGPHRVSARQACALRQPVRPLPMGHGTVIGLQQPEMAEADIPSREARLGGAIDPSYLHDGRAVVRQDGGRTQTFDVLPGMNVQVGDRVSLQNSYRSTAAPCAYVPIQIIGDAKPVQTLAEPVAAPSDLLSLPAGIRTMVNQHDRHVLGQSLPVSITILVQPAHGTVTTGTAGVPVPTYAGIVHRTATQVFYQSVPGYTGPDGFTYRRTSPDPADPLNAQTYTISFQVK